MSGLETLLTNISTNSYGVEIGGPSKSNPLYENSASIDNIVFSKSTIWENHTDTFNYYPNKSGRVIINDAVDITSVHDGTYDFVFGSHCLEHIANPLKALFEWSRIIKDGGYMVLILPERSECFDHMRSISSFSTILSQYEKNVGEDDLSTLPEILEKHDRNVDIWEVRDFEKFRERSLDNFNNRCLHHYVYSPDLLKELCAFIKFEFVYTETRGLDIWFVARKPTAVGNPLINPYQLAMDGVASVHYVLNNSVPGCLVECGVQSGDFQKIWIDTLQERSAVRDIYLYDTFAGMQKPGPNDYTREDSSIYTWEHTRVMLEWTSYIIDDKTNGWCYTPLDDVKNRLEKTGYPTSHLHYVVGDVMKTLSDPENIPSEIAILRLDTDWYESSKYELEMLYDNVSSRGVIVFDDYFHWDGQRRATDEFFASRGLKPRIVPVGNGKTGYMIKT